MLKRVLLVDGNHLIYRAFFKFQRLSTLDGVQTGIVYGGPYILESIIRKLGPDEVIITFDNKKSQFRLGLLPDYKKRDSKLGQNKEDFFRQRDTLIEIFISLGLRVYRPYGYEADDVIAYLNQQYYRKDWETIIASADKDFIQLINDKTLVYNVSKGILVDKWNCKKHYGYTPAQCVDYLSLLGDDSDKIPGYPGIGKKRAAKFLEQFGSVKAFLRSDKSFGKVDKEKLREIYNRNYKLINLMYFIRKELVPEEIIPINPTPTFNIKWLKELLAANEINSFLKPQFLKTYTYLHEKQV